MCVYNVDSLHCSGDMHGAGCKKERVDLYKWVGDPPGARIRGGTDGIWDYGDTGLED